MALIRLIKIVVTELLHLSNLCSFDHLREIVKLSLELVIFSYWKLFHKHAKQFSNN